MSAVYQLVKLSPAKLLQNRLKSDKGALTQTKLSADSLLAEAEGDFHIPGKVRLTVKRLQRFHTRVSITVCNVAVEKNGREQSSAMKVIDTAVHSRMASTAEHNSFHFIGIVRWT